MPRARGAHGPAGSARHLLQHQQCGRRRGGRRYVHTALHARVLLKAWWGCGGSTALLHTHPDQLRHHRRGWVPRLKGVGGVRHVGGG